MEQRRIMDFRPEFVGSSWGREFAAGGLGSIAGAVSGYPLDTLRIRQLHSKTVSSAFTILRIVISTEGIFCPL
ncbi:hypothetical protein FNV43_RR06848 [Rhamnella rubrinervis]|uniref:Solute carrier family 25 member 45 n=1 Tax=Rhamnella rubrinervis TaxID=2594499 RepID=A0A8K0HEK8_9ROSA|nr:hypothetical protein FNV43_RR06848 [Rhamnella rubrinervis]